jgi:hypothetical protein
MPAKRAIQRSKTSRNPEVAELNVERKNLTVLKPHPRNPRKHPDKGSPEWEVLKKSLEHDYFDPLVWNSRNGKLVSGHLRRKVFMEMGVKSADVVVVDYDEPTHLARMIAANKSIGMDDVGKLAEVFHELGAIEEFDLSLTGFTLGELPAARSPEGDEESGGEETYTSSDIDKITEFFGKGAKPTVKTAMSQVWRVGHHYLYIGSVLHDHARYVPLLSLLQGEFPERKVLLVPMPDPLMIGSTDTKVSAVFVQPSPLAASLALSLLRKKSPKHPITLVPDETAPRKARKAK